jgi:hypothetical protein
MNMKQNDGPEVVLVCDVCGSISLTHEQSENPEPGGRRCPLDTAFGST